MLPPCDSLTRLLRLGAGRVSFSGGTGSPGPQSTGIVAGRRDLARSAALDASPDRVVGRAARPS